MRAATNSFRQPKSTYVTQAVDALAARDLLPQSRLQSRRSLLQLPLQNLHLLGNLLQLFFRQIPTATRVNLSFRAIIPSKKIAAIVYPKPTRRQATPVGNITVRCRFESK